MKPTCSRACRRQFAHAHLACFVPTLSVGARRRTAGNREHMQRDRLRDMRQAPTVYGNHVAPPSGRTPVPSTPTRCSMTCQCLPLTGTVPVAPGGGLPKALRPKTSPAAQRTGAATCRKTTGDLATRRGAGEPAAQKGSKGGHAEARRPGVRPATPVVGHVMEEKHARPHHPPPAAQGRCTNARP